MGLTMEYLSIRETAEKWGITVRRVQSLCSAGRIPGACKIGSYWAIPSDAEKPKDERCNNGQYMKIRKRIKSFEIIGIRIFQGRDCRWKQQLES